MIDKCESCYWFESTGEGKNMAVACRSPKWEWTEEETRIWREESKGNEFAVRSSLPDFDESRHCDYKFCKLGESFVDVEYGQPAGVK